MTHDFTCNNSTLNIIIICLYIVLIKLPLNNVLRLLHPYILFNLPFNALGTLVYVQNDRPVFGLHFLLIVVMVLVLDPVTGKINSHSNKIEPAHQ